jgi:hypothetical protein
MVAGIRRLHVEISCNAETGKRETEMATYSYNEQKELSAMELFFVIAVEKTLEQLGVKDIGAVVAVLSGQPILPTRGKLYGMTKGTSVASVVCRLFITYEAKTMRLPMLTGNSLKTLRIAMTKNLGAFVGRTVPVVGWIILTYDVVRIMWSTVTAYNKIVSAQDRLVP